MPPAPVLWVRFRLREVPQGEERGRGQCGRNGCGGRAGEEVKWEPWKPPQADMGADTQTGSAY